VFLIHQLGVNQVKKSARFTVGEVAHCWTSASSHLNCEQAVHAACFSGKKNMENFQKFFQKKKFPNIKSF